MTPRQQSKGTWNGGRKNFSVINDVKDGVTDVVDRVRAVSRAVSTVELLPEIAPRFLREPTSGDPGRDKSIGRGAGTPVAKTPERPSAGAPGPARCEAARAPPLGEAPRGSIVADRNIGARQRAVANCHW